MSEHVHEWESRAHEERTEWVDERRHRDDHDAFVQAFIYHQMRNGGCLCGAELPLGSSLAEHAWRVYDGLRHGEGAS